MVYIIDVKEQKWYQKDYLLSIAALHEKQIKTRTRIIIALIIATATGMNIYGQTLTDSDDTLTPL